MVSSSCTWISEIYELQNLLPIEILEPRTLKLTSECTHKTPGHGIVLWIKDLTSTYASCVPKTAQRQKSMLLYNYRNGKGVQSKTSRIICGKYGIEDMHDTCKLMEIPGKKAKKTYIKFDTGQFVIINVD